MFVQFRVGIIGLTERLQSPGCHSCWYDDVHAAENNDALPMGSDTVQGGPAGVNLDAKKYESLYQGALLNGWIKSHTSRIRITSLQVQLIGRWHLIPFRQYIRLPFLGGSTWFSEPC